MLLLFHELLEWIPIFQHKVQSIVLADPLNTEIEPTFVFDVSSHIRIAFELDQRLIWILWVQTKVSSVEVPTSHFTWEDHIVDFDGLLVEWLPGILPDRWLVALVI